MIPHEMIKNLKRPLWIAGASALLSVVFLMLTGKETFICISALFVIACVLLCVLRFYAHARAVLIVSLVFLLFGGSFLYHENCVVAPSMQLLGETADITGTVYEKPRASLKTTLVPLENCVINGRETKLRISAYCKYASGLAVGDTVSIKSANIFDAPERDQFYYHTLSSRCWLKAYGVSAEKTGGSGGKLIYRVRTYRYRVSERIRQAVPGENGEIAAALLIGDKSGFTDTFKYKLQVSGASHLFAVSGMHLSIWAGVLYLLFRKNARNKRIPNVAVIVFVLFYMLITGLSPSVTRAGIMLITICAAKLIRRQSDPLNALGLSVLLLLAGNIYLAGNVSFLLSVFATFAIITVYPYFEAIKERKDRRPVLTLKNLLNGIFLSFSVLLVSAPVVGYFFNCVSLLSPVSSLLCVIPAEINMVSTLLALLFGSLQRVFGVPFYFITEISAGLINKCIYALGGLEFCLFPVRPGYLLIWYLCTGAIVAAAYLITKNRYKTLLALLLSAALLISSEIVTRTVNANKIEICVPNNTNATSVCVLSNSNAYSAMIGTGEAYDDFKATRAFLNKRGVFYVNQLIIPRVSNAENGNLRYFAELSDQIVSAADNALLNELGTDAVQSDCFTLKLGNGMTYKNVLTFDYAAGLLFNENVKIVFSFFPGGDFQNAPEELRRGDYLLARGGIPRNIDIALFKHVIVLTDKTPKELHLPEGATTTGEKTPVIIKTTVSD